MFVSIWYKVLLNTRDAVLMGPEAVLKYGLNKGHGNVLKFINRLQLYLTLFDQ